jgi:hypothetical protein
MAMWSFLHNGDTANRLDAAQRIRSVDVIARNDDCDHLAVPAIGQRKEKYSNDIRPATRLGDRLESKPSILQMQIPIGRDDEHPVRLYLQPFRDHFDWHFGEA